MTIISEWRIMHDLIERLTVEPRGSCPCHCVWCGGPINDWRGHEHEDDCPYIQAKRVVDPDWRQPVAGWLASCDECELAEAGVEHSYKEHKEILTWASAARTEVQPELSKYADDGDHQSLKEAKARAVDRQGRYYLFVRWSSEEESWRFNVQWFNFLGPMYGYQWTNAVSCSGYPTYRRAVEDGLTAMEVQARRDR